MRRRCSETRSRIGGSAVRDSGGLNGQADEISEINLKDEADGIQGFDRTDKPLDKAPTTQPSPPRDHQNDGPFQQTGASHAFSKHQLIDDSGQEHLSNVPSAAMTSAEPTTTLQSQVSNVTGTVDLASVEWSYLDTQGIVQGECLRISGGGLTPELVQALSVRKLCKIGMTRDTSPRIS